MAIEQLPDLVRTHWSPPARAEAAEVPRSVGTRGLLGRIGSLLDERSQDSINLAAQLVAQLPPAMGSAIAAALAGAAPPRDEHSADWQAAVVGARRQVEAARLALSPIISPPTRHRRSRRQGLGPPPPVPMRSLDPPPVRT